MMLFIATAGKYLPCLIASDDLYLQFEINVRISFLLEQQEYVHSSTIPTVLITLKIYINISVPTLGWALQEKKSRSKFIFSVYVFPL